MARFLVTGGAGFIGSHLVERLVRDGNTVRVLDDLSTGKLDNLSSVLSDIDFVEGSVCDIEVCRKAIKEVSFVLHLAALSSSPQSVEEPLRTNEVNVMGTLNLLLCARETGIEKFVCAGSSSAYGETVGVPFKEVMQLKPITPYGVSKYVQELYCLSFFKVYGLPTVSLRYFNVYGPRQEPGSVYASVIPAFATALLSGNTPEIHGDGLQTRDFIYVEDVVDASLLACEKDSAVGLSINVGSGVAVSIRDLLEVMAEILSVNASPAFAPMRPGDLRHTLADVELASKVLGFRPRYSLREGLAVTLKWFREAFS